MKIRHLFAFLMLLLTQVPAQAQSLASKIENQGTPRHVQITGIASRQENGLLSLYIEFSNTDKKDQPAYYRVNWLDESGFPVWAEESWKPVLVHGLFTEKVVAVSPTVKARDFKIQFSDQKDGSPTPTKNNQH